MNSIQLSEPISVTVQMPPEYNWGIPRLTYFFYWKPNPVRDVVLQEVTALVRPIWIQQSLEMKGRLQKILQASSSP